ncbi:beta-ketoacyl-[acyl-carrier-protein] synthase family protein [Sandaracinobacteroides saxicola]|nr:beta-ketoacyl-[acyl-carrier-protein] synthase family protein [Sandaracinobacteroides saxicola]
MICAGGLTAGQSWETVRDGISRVAPAQAGRDRSTAAIPVAAIAGFDPAGHFERNQLVALDPVAQYAVIAAREAIAQSGLALADHAPERTRCIVGSGTGGEVTHDHASRQVYDQGASRLHPMTVPKIMLSAVASHVALDLQIKGGVYAVSSACASAAHAIGQAFWDIRHGMVDVAVAGGSEACLTYGCLKAWQALHVLSDDLCRPFSLGRRGLILGEGAAILVLEAFETAQARGADILAEIVGFGMSCDAASITAPDAHGMARAMNSALADARLPATAVDHVNAHGTGTHANDQTESHALRLVFGDRLPAIPVTANKSVLGHALGASGALEMAVAIMTLRTGIIPPTANHLEADPGCAVDCVPNAARQAHVKTLLSNSFAFGGLNASLAVCHV